jgi:glycosyltransferase involved in cell wall biosynthesis
MKVAHLLGSLMPSGMERMLVSSAQHFEALGVSTLVIGQGNRHPFAGALRDAGLTVEIVSPVAHREGRSALRRLLRASKPDVVHIHAEANFALTVSAVLSALPGVAIVRTVHSVFLNSGRGYVTRRAQAYLADGFVHTFVAPSPDVARNELRYNRQCEVIFNWVEDRFHALREKRASAANSAAHERQRSVVIVGNSSPIKNQVRVLEALLPTRLDVYMHGDESKASARERELLDRLEAAGRLRHRGVGDPAESLTRASAYAMPSVQEGMGVALAEALTVGLPCYVTDAPGLQWPKRLAGVTSLPNEHDPWARAMHELDTQSGDVDWVIPPVDIDFSATRGAAEYADLYDRASGGRP